MRLHKRLLAILMNAALIGAYSGTALAHDVPDESRRGSIHITMHQGDKAVGGGTLTLYRVGAVHEDEGNYDFVLTGDFAACTASLDDIQSSALADSLARYAGERSLRGTEKVIASDGTVTFTDLELGLYLLVQNRAADGYNAAAPFLVSVPMMEDGTYIYDVNASPKTELETAPPKPDNPSGSSPTEKLPQTGQLTCLFLCW